MIFIKIKVKGYLKNITENEIIEFEERAIRNKNKITFSCDNVKTTIKINDNDVVMIREGIDFINSFVFNIKNSCCNYLIKNNNYDVNIDINTIAINVSADSIYIKYLIIDSQCKYEYKLEMSDI